MNTSYNKTHEIKLHVTKHTMNITHLVHEEWKYKGTYFNNYEVVMIILKPFNIGRRKDGITHK